MTNPANLKHCEKCGHVRCYACGRALCTCHTREDATCDDGCRCDAKDWSLFEHLVNAGVPASDIDHHESDLYVRATPLVSRVIDKLSKARDPEPPSHKYGRPKAIFFTTFISNRDGKLWLDIPFAYQPWWDRRLGRTRQEG